MFQNQQNSGVRGAPLGTSRLQNGKLGEETAQAIVSQEATNAGVRVPGSGSQWAFGGPMGGAPGLATTQSRANGSALSSFAQTIGGSQPHGAPLNLE
jgi:CCR4-NOT transcription complex subunit 2